MLKTLFMFAIILCLTTNVSNSNETNVEYTNKYSTGKLSCVTSNSPVGSDDLIDNTIPHSSSQENGSVELEAIFTSASPWLTGVDIGGTTFNGSIVFGQQKYRTNSNLNDSDLVPVRIIFSDSDSTLCQTYLGSDWDITFPPTGVGVFPGTAWDISDPDNPRRLNLCFSERNFLNHTNDTNYIWDPKTGYQSNYEFLYIMKSSYDGTAMTYANESVNPLEDSLAIDVMYFFYPRISSGLTLLETLPAVLEIRILNIIHFSAIPDSSSIILTWGYKIEDPDHFDIYFGTEDSLNFLTTISGSDRTFTHDGLAFDQEYFYYIQALTVTDSVLETSKTVSSVTQLTKNNMSLFSYLNEYNSYADIWGYTVNDSEYALVCVREKGVSIVDISSNPPVEVGFITPPNQGVDSKDIKTYQNFAILINENADVQIFDLTDITNPSLVSTYTPSGGGAHNCLVDGDYLYVVGSLGNSGIKIIDISNPFLPVEIGDFQPFYYHDLAIRNDTICATGIYGDGIDLIDVTDKSNPTLISRWNYPGSGAHNAEFSFDGSHVFIGDEIGSSGNHIRTFNITNPNNITLASEIIVDPSAIIHNCYSYEDTLLVIAHYTLGVRIWNVADPSNPFEVAFYDTYYHDGVDHYGFIGCWGVYTGFASGKIIASDMENGLFVLETNFPPPPPCCVSPRGNVDSDVGDAVDISDLVFIVDFIFTGGPPPTCTEEANVDGDIGEEIDISDLVFIVDFIFTDGPAPSACP